MWCMWETFCSKSRCFVTMTLQSMFPVGCHGCLNLSKVFFSLFCVCTCINLDFKIVHSEYGYRPNWVGDECFKDSKSTEYSLEIHVFGLQWGDEVVSDFSRVCPSFCSGQVALLSLYCKYVCFCIANHRKPITEQLEYQKSSAFYFWNHSPTKRNGLLQETPLKLIQAVKMGERRRKNLGVINLFEIVSYWKVASFRDYR